MKEQTPITAEKFILHLGYEKCWDYLTPSKISPLMEQYANAKVLEHDKIQREKIAEVTKEVIQSKVLEERERINNIIESITFQDPAAAAFYEELKLKLKG